MCSYPNQLSVRGFHRPNMVIGINRCLSSWQNGENHMYMCVCQPTDQSQSQSGVPYLDSATL
jgi:hypothetical protein